MAANRTVQVTLTAYVTPFTQGLDKASNGLLQFSRKADLIGSSLRNVGATMTRALSIPATGILGLGIKAFSGLDKQLTESTAMIQNVTAEQKKALNDLAIDMSNKSIRSAKEYSEGYKWLLQSGLDVEQTMAAIGPASDLAIAGLMELDDTVSKLMGSLSALNLKSKDPDQLLGNMKDLSDRIVSVANASQGSVSDMLDAVSNRAASAARMANIPLNEMIGVLGVFADQSLKGAAAGTQFDIMIRELQKTSIKGGKSWENILGSGNGVKVYDDAGNMRNLVEIFKDFDKALGNMSPKQRMLAMQSMKIPQRSMTGILRIVGMSDKLEEYTNSVQKAGEASRVAGEMQKSFWGEMKIVWNNVTNAAEAIGEILAPYIKELGNFVRELASKFRDLSPETKKFVAFALVIAAVLGPVIYMFGTFVGFITKLAMVPLIGLTLLTTVFSFLVTTLPAIVAGVSSLVAFLATLGVTLPVLAAIAGMVAIGIPFAFHGAKKSVNSFVQSIIDSKGVIIGFVSNIGENMALLFNWFKENESAFIAGVKDVWDNIGSIIFNSIVKAMVSGAKVGFKAVYEMSTIGQAEKYGKMAYNWITGKSNGEESMGYDPYASLSKSFKGLTAFPKFNTSQNKGLGNETAGEWMDRMYDEVMSMGEATKNATKSFTSASNDYTPIDKNKTVSALEYGTASAYEAAYKGNDASGTKQDKIEENTKRTADSTEQNNKVLNSLLSAVKDQGAFEVGTI